MECHSFGVELATKYGIAEALLLSYFRYYIESAEKKQDPDKFHDGRYWTYASTRELARRFPYISKTPLWRALQHLLAEELLLKGNYNKYSWDKTVWYTLSDKGWQEVEGCSKWEQGVPNGNRGVPNGNRGVPNGNRGVPNGNDNTYSIHLFNPLCNRGNKQTDNTEVVNNNRFPGTKHDQETYNKAVSAYEKYIKTPLTASVVEEICAIVDDFDLEATIYGFRTASRNNVRKLGYVETCARNYVAGGDKPKRQRGRAKNDVEGTVKEALRLLGVNDDE